MTRTITAILTATLLIPLLLAPSAVAQDYWEDDVWGNRVYHEPLLGRKTTYDNGTEVEQQAYEWEPGEGYHQEEWYDPSDWFDDDDIVDYEYDYDYDYDYDYGDYDYGDYDYGYGYYDYDDYDYDYDYPYADYDYSLRNRDYNYEFDQQARGEVVALERIRGAYGAPQSVRLRLRTDDGQTRTLHLGDLAYVEGALPRIKKGERIVIGGRYIDVDGRRTFKGEEIRSAAGSYRIPDYEYERRIEGRLVGIRNVRTRDGNVEAVIAKVQPWEGKTMNVLLGSAESLNQQGQSIKPGARVQVDGYRREVNGQSSFVVQDVKILQQPDGQQQQGERQAQRQQGERQAQRQQGERQAQRNQSTERQSDSQNRDRQQTRS